MQPLKSVVPVSLLVLVGALLVLSCEPSVLGPTEQIGPKIASVTISPSIITLDAPGATAQFTARVRDEQGREMTEVTVSWLTTDPDVAGVSDAGLATALEEGSSVIIAVASEDVSGWATLNVDYTELLIKVGALPPAVLGESYSQTLTAEGASSPSWSISEGSLPDGLSLNGATGVISGTPTAIGVDHFTLVLTDRGNSVSRDLTIVVISPTLGRGFGSDQFELIQAGSFQMGSATGAADEQPVHTVNITQPFYMQKTEVTQAQWIEIMGTNPVWSANCGETCAVEKVAWDKIQEFISILNTTYPGQNFRLPTEAEWEYAARAGSTGDYGGTGVLDDVGWYVGNSASRVWNVGLKKPNAWGLYDMHGNVEEWVNDTYSATYYSESPADTPPGPESGEYKVLRGGSTTRDASEARSSSRETYRSNYTGFTIYLGFRLAKNPRRSPHRTTT